MHKEGRAKGGPP